MQLQDTVLDEASTRSRIAATINAASQHDVEYLNQLIDSFTFDHCKVVDVQDPISGYTPLHAAVASCKYEDGKPNPDGIQHAHEIIKTLLENGAIWNQLDRNSETPGCIAFRLELDTLYRLMVDAGVRAEMLLNRLDEYEELDEDEESDEVEEDHAEQRPVSTVPENLQAVSTYAADGDQPTKAISDDSDTTSAKYLSSTLSMSGDKILDDDSNGVMMAWEGDIMNQSANILLPSPDLKFLNVGFGMGIIDSHIQAHSNKPAEHHIIEAHPDVLKSMKHNGWFNKPGVTIHAGKWQDILPKLIEDGAAFDAVYYDTFAESYKDFKDFFTEHLLSLLEQSGVWSYFNGMGADRQISYDVYQKIVELDLFEAGFEVEWTHINLPDLSATWDGVNRKYWNIKQYRLPLCRFME